jgi:23S rRNA pseudouridine955/2504/2580 synthase
MTQPSSDTKENIHLISWREEGMRFDRWLLKMFPEISYGQFAKLLRKGQIRLNGKRVEGNERLEKGASVRLPPASVLESMKTKDLQEPRFYKVSSREKEELKSWILYEDADMIIFNKPAGLAVQGGSGTHTHLDGLLTCLTEEGHEKPKLVHRLDKDTSGILIVAKHGKAASHLTEAFKTHRVKKLYWAITAGVPTPLQGEIYIPLRKQSGKYGEQMKPDYKEGDKAITYFTVLDHAGKTASLVALRPLTGRTHQLRVHMAETGTPIVGDGKYGGIGSFVDGLKKELHLHARFLEIPMLKGKVKSFTAPLPSLFQESLRNLGFADRGYQELESELLKYSPEG